MAKDKAEKKSKKEIKEVIPEPEPEVDEVEEVEDDSKEDTAAIVPSFIDLYNEIEKIDNQLIADLKKKKGLMKILQKTYLADIKKAKKNRRSKNTEEKGERTPSGFNKPSVVPDKICDILELEYGTELARTAVTKELYNYIRKNGLQNEDDRRKINPDEKLIDLFGLTKGEELTFSTFQTFMKRLYPSKEEREEKLKEEKVEKVEEPVETDKDKKKKKKSK